MTSSQAPESPDVALPASLTERELAAGLTSAAAAEELSLFNDVPFVLVELEAHADSGTGSGTGSQAALPRFRPGCPVLAIGDGTAPSDLVDVVVPSVADAREVAASIVRHPVAASVLVRLLRHNENVDVSDGLFAESLAYSTLQHGAEFQSWLAERRRRLLDRPPRGDDPAEPVVLLSRKGDELEITLNRPHKRNAYSAGLRDGLCEALELLATDASIERAVLMGAGAAFSAGGDLDEFGEATDAAIAHATRMSRSAGALIHHLRERLEVRVHGACIGAGIELPSFAKRITASSSAFFQLPEVAMGLIPGAGGTVSILGRIGRRRLAFMALTGRVIDVATALEWGLVDGIRD